MDTAPQIVDRLAQELFIDSVMSADPDKELSNKDVLVMARLAYSRAHQFAMARAEYHSSVDRHSRRGVLMSETPRTDAARIEHARWDEYAKHYWHLPEAMECAPKDADPFAVAEELERELAAVTRERDKLQAMAGANALAGLEVGRENDAFRAEIERLRVRLSSKRAIFQAGRDSYKTDCNPMNTDDEAWTEFARASLQEPTP
jgi:hypothetical protein